MTSASPAEIALVALTLSAVTRLQQSFVDSGSMHGRSLLLLAAADLLDKTMPMPDLKEALRKQRVEDQVAFLVTHREQVAAVPPAFWRPPRVKLNDLPAEHYRGLRALEHALKKDYSASDKTWRILAEWLAPAWDQYPALTPECAHWRTPEANE